MAVLNGGYLVQLLFILLLDLVKKGTREMIEGIWIGLAMIGSFVLGFFTAIHCINLALENMKKAQEK